jgi:Mtf2 family
MSGVEPPSAGTWEFDPEKSSFRDSTEGQRGFKIRKHAVKSFEPDNVEDLEGNVFAMPETIDFDEDIDDDLPGKDEIQELTDTHQNRGSTITIAERHAFQKIFSDIFENSQRLSSNKEALFSTDNIEMDAGPGNQHKAKSKLDNILTNAMRRERAGTREAAEAAVERYPPALRAAAARAMGLIDDEANYEEATSREGKLLDTEELEALREPERARVEGLMKNAKSDFELWEIMEKEVFTLIARLGLEDAPRAQDAAVPQRANKKKGRKKSTIEAVSEEEAPSKPKQSLVSEPDNGVSPLSLYGPLYPSYLLLGLRLFDRGFTKPSPLALSILPRIKSLGFISHVLGASTQFYNELLRIYRYRQDDFRGMFNLLTEMEHSALEVDEETLEIVLDVMRTQFSVRRGEKGSAIRALWSMPEFMPNKFRVWRDSIQCTIDEREEAKNQFRY